MKNHGNQQTEAFIDQGKNKLNLQQLYDFLRRIIIRKKFYIKKKSGS